MTVDAALTLTNVVVMTVNTGLILFDELLRARLDLVDVIQLVLDVVELLLRLHMILDHPSVLL